MGILDDIASAAQSYPVDNVDLEVVEIQFPGSALNTNEEGSFRVRVINNGPVRLKDVVVRVRARNGLEVKSNNAIATFGDEIEVHFRDDIEPGDSGTSGGSVFHFRAPNASQPVRNLIRLTMKEWKVDLNSISESEQGPSSEPVGIWAEEVIAA